MQATTQALKEWNVAVQALEQGQTILLLRKGGIREAGGQFTVKDTPVWLYPTYEHQKPELLKSPYDRQVQPVASGWHPETVRISSWAQLTDVFAVHEASTVKALFPFHIWTETFVTERLKWKPSQPLYVLLLRVYRIQPQDVPYSPRYGGCQSWIHLESAIALDQANPVFTEVRYAEQIADIQSVLLSQ